MQQTVVQIIGIFSLCHSPYPPPPPVDHFNPYSKLWWGYSVLYFRKRLFFDIKLAYRTLWKDKNHDNEPNFDLGKVWNTHCPPKLRFFLWTILWNRLPTASMLSNRNIVPNQCCHFCPGIVENLDHLFCECPRAVEIWEGSLFKSKTYTTGFNNRFLENIFSTQYITQLASIIPHNTMFAFCLWRIWIGRNLWLAFSKW